MAEPVPVYLIEAQAGFHEREPIEFEPEPAAPFLGVVALVAALGSIGLFVAAGYGVCVLYDLL